MSLFSNFGKRFIEARQRQAQIHVNSVLSGFDDETLKRAGFDRKNLNASARAAYYL